eukprot:TRINITY_DN6744_c0_g1_i1.p1 TRINITY_DN6744_c0_g1~~TRINITY_DN6744_c0_g1_i1.p1  ORF type:complete len:1338 (+),score=244.77 TRINITY_DN6744_c0_g1_i1:61-4074(+)
MPDSHVSGKHDETELPTWAASRLPRSAALAAADWDNSAMLVQDVNSHNGNGNLSLSPVSRANVLKAESGLPLHDVHHGPGERVVVGKKVQLAPQEGDATGARCVSVRARRRVDNTDLNASSRPTTARSRPATARSRPTTARSRSTTAMSMKQRELQEVEDFLDDPALEFMDLPAVVIKSIRSEDFPLAGVPFTSAHPHAVSEGITTDSAEREVSPKPAPKQVAKPKSDSESGPASASRVRPEPVNLSDAPTSPKSPQPKMPNSRLDNIFHHVESTSESSGRRKAPRDVDVDVQSMSPSKEEANIDGAPSPPDDCGSPAPPSVPTSPQSSRFAFRKIKNILKPKQKTAAMSEISGDGTGDVGWDGNCLHKLRMLVTMPKFEATFCLLIMANTIVMAFQVQYVGLENGYQLYYWNAEAPASELWPGAEMAFLIVEWSFGAVFTLEIVLKLVAFHYRFFKDPWNVLDFIVVGAWILDTVSEGILPIDPMLLRLLRLIKLLRLLRLIRTMNGFDSLYIMITSIKGSIYALLWTILLLLIVLMLMALLISTLVEAYIQDTAQPPKRRMEVFKYFGTFSRASVTMLELTLANWVPASRALTENISEWYLIFVLTFKATVGFSVVKVIMGVFLQVTFHVAANDDLILMSSQERAVKLHTKKISKLFEAADQDGNGRLDEEEFEQIMDDPTVVSWLSAMGFEANYVNAADIYRLLDTAGKGDLTAEEMIRGVSRLKGPASSLNLAILHKDAKEMDQMLSDISCDVDLSIGGPADPPADDVNAQRESDSDEDQEPERVPMAGAPRKRASVSEMMFESKKTVYFDEEDGEESARKERCGGLRMLRRKVVKLTESFAFEMTFAGLIIGCTIQMVFQAQYNGLQTGHDLGFDGFHLSAAEAWPLAEEGFAAVDLFFGAVFTLEILLKLLAQLHYFFCEAWNILDTLIVGFWYVETLSSATLPLDPMILRLFRLVRLLRMARLVKILEKYDALYLMLTSIKGSIATLAWSSVLLVVIQTLCALFLVTMCEIYLMADPTRNSPEQVAACSQNMTDLCRKHEVYKYYGTFTRAMLTLFEITLGNWVVVTRTMMNNATDTYVIFAVFHKFFIGFAVVMVITGVFVQETLKVAQTDNTIMLNQRERATRLHVKKMTALFQVTDTDGNGRLDIDEWLEVCSDPSVKLWMSALGLDVSDAGEVHSQICEANGGIEDLSAKELVMGVSHLKGAARNMDMALLRKNFDDFRGKLEELQKKVKSQYRHQEASRHTVGGLSQIGTVAETQGKNLPSSREGCKAELKRVEQNLAKLESEEIEGLSVREALRLQRQLLQRKSELLIGLKPLGTEERQLSGHV